MTDTNVHGEPESAAAATSTSTSTMPPVHPTTTTTTTTTTTAEVPTGTTHTGGTTAEVPTGTTPTGDTTSSPSSHEKDPRIASLHALFPDYDDLILYSVLDSVNGDQDRAIDALLGMSDPEYKGEVHPAADAGTNAALMQEAGLTQTELDEQFARRLMLEEQDAQQAAWIAQQEEAREARQRPPQPPQQGQQQQGQGDTMAELQQQFGKFAETGKKTFNTFFNKVKAKIQEKDQPRTPQSSTYSYDHSQYEQRTSEHQAYTHVPYATRPRTQVPVPAPASQLTPAQQPAYYDPNPSPDPDPRAASMQMQGYDTTSTPGLGLQFEGATTPPNAPTPPPAGTSATTPPPNDTQQRPLTSPPIDGGKYGLLPKRPVTLLRPAEPTQLQRQHSLDDSDDGLEYAESPFEGKK